jgi:DNA-binding transcriptional ArsR family regulator
VRLIVEPPAWQMTWQIRKPMLCRGPIRRSHRWGCHGRPRGLSRLRDLLLQLYLTFDNHMVMVSECNALLTMFSRLADPARRELFERLTRDDEHPVHALTERAGVSQPMVSKHLKRARWVNNRRSGRETRYSAQTQALAPLFDRMRLYRYAGTGSVSGGRFSQVIAGTDSFS